MPERPIAMLPWWVRTAAIGAFGQALYCAVGLEMSGTVWALRTLLLALPLATMAAVMALVDVAGRALAPQRWTCSPRMALTLVLTLLLGGAAAWIVGFETSASFGSARGWEVAGTFGIGAIGLAVLLGRGFSRSERVRRWGTDRIGAVGLPPLAAASYLAGRSVDLSPFWPLRYPHPFVEALLCLLAAAFLRRAGWVGRRAALSGVAALALAAAVVGVSSREAIHRACGRVLLRTGAARRVLTIVRALADRDGDGYSSLLDGGDCDDRDPNAYPLGPKDCDGLSGAAPAPAVAPKVAPVSRLLVVTIDAWRCELDGAALCPDMARIGEDASYRGAQRVFVAQTKRSIGALFGAPYRRSGREADDRPAPLLAAARAGGYRSKAFLPLSILRVPAAGGMFDEREELTLSPSTLERAHSGQLAKRVMAELPGGGKRFVWAHFLDPHAPYFTGADGDEAPFLLLDQRRGYAAEVLRTQRDVSAVVEHARQTGFGRDAAIVVTGDHGETFSHGYRFHGASSYESDLTVPLWVWLFDADGRRVPLTLPPEVAERDVAALLAGLLGAPPPPGQTAISLTDSGDGDEQLAVVDGVWKLVYHRQAHVEELYDLATDPEEEVNRIEDRPDVAERVRKRLAAELGELGGGRR